VWLVTLVLVVAGFFPSWAQAGRHTVASWDMAQGLPHNLVQSLAQGTDGFIWIGTWEGVVRFNGRSFTVFDRQNTPGVELSGILSILAEADGAMLFGTASDGVYRYHKGAWQPLGGADARQLSVVAMLRDHDGSLWIATNERLLRLSVSGVLEDASAAMGLPVVPVTALRPEWRHADRHRGGDLPSCAATPAAVAQQPGMARARSGRRWCRRLGCGGR
jgi:hypothetical protein